jgi:serine/threonine-protein kinase
VISERRYKLVRTLASGGMAQVLEALVQGLDGFERRVALKRLLPRDVEDEERRWLFRHEAELGSRFHHGGIVQVLDFGMLDGTEFMALEYVDGVDTLRAVSREYGRGGMPEGVALHVAAEVAHALDYLHGFRDEESKLRAVVHRDVGPGNLLVSWDGDVKLCDFGIAIAESAQERRPGRLFRRGRVIGGTPSYMAPEQALGRRVTAAADVYALGVTLGVLLGGRSVTGGVPPHQIRQLDLSPGVGALLAACVAHDPARRPEAAEVAARAGRLAARTLGRDGRGALRHWLRPLRALERRRRGVDDLMGLCLEPAPTRGTGTSLVERGRLDRGLALLRRPLRRAPERVT